MSNKVNSKIPMIPRHKLQAPSAPTFTKSNTLRRSLSLTDLRVNIVKQNIKTGEILKPILNKPNTSQGKGISSTDLKLKTKIITNKPELPKQTLNRPYTLRRSKSVTDIRPLMMNKQPLKPLIGKNNENKPSSILNKKPLKRLAAPVTKSLASQNKIAKVEKPPLPRKPAPYDYKARFNLLKEQHDKLKEAHVELKGLVGKNEELALNNQKLTSELETKEKILHDTKENFNKTFKQNQELTSKVIKLEKDFSSVTESFESTLKELTELKQQYSELNSIYTKESEELLVTKSELESTKLYADTMRKEMQKLENEKRKLHNLVQELKGNIRVFCRIRPRIESEINEPLYNINYVNEKTVELSNGKDKKNEFSFDKVFGPSSSQENIFEELSQLVQSALDGYNVCVFAYGQTGSGKTYTMEGFIDSVHQGMIPRSVDTIFTLIENLKVLGWTYKVQASFLEIYNESIVDLLDPTKTHLEIRMCDPKGSDLYVQNLTVEDIDSANYLKQLMKLAQKNRAVAATENNDRSSRSHSVTKITLLGSNLDQNVTYTGSLNLVDLAGSEKFHTTETTRLRETTNINKSLSNLNNVILCLVEKKSHIPYRNSKLTHLLMPSLGGNSKTLMLVNISPLINCYNESVNSLRFASNVNKCYTGAIRRMKTQ